MGESDKVIRWLPLARDLGSLFVFLALALLSIYLMRLLKFEDGLPIFVAILSAIVMLYLRLRMRLNSISERLGSNDGLDIGIMGDNSSVSNIGYSLSKSLVILAANGESLLLDLALLRKDVSRSLERMQSSLQVMELSQRDLAQDNESGIEGEDSDGESL